MIQNMWQWQAPRTTGGGGMPPLPAQSSKAEHLAGVRHHLKPNFYYLTPNPCGYNTGFRPKVNQNSHKPAQPATCTTSRSTVCTDLAGQMLSGRQASTGQLPLGGTGNFFAVRPPRAWVLKSIPHSILSQPPCCQWSNI